MRRNGTGTIARRQGIPGQLLALHQWVAWRLENRSGKEKSAKVPINPRTGKNADVSRFETWGSFTQAQERCEQDRLDGVGFVLTEDDPFVCIDIDNCRNVETGELTENAQWLLMVFRSYAEISPSGTGVHIWVRGEIPRNARQDGVEIYGARRFMTVTGQELKGWKHPGVAERAAALKSLTEQAAGESINKRNLPAMPPLGADERGRILRAAELGPDRAKFLRLWSGDSIGYTSKSEADLALCRILALHCGYRKKVVDALFRESALFREKWDRPSSASGETYGQVTVAKGITRARFELKKRWAVRSGSDTQEVDAKRPENLVDGILPVRALGVVAGNSGLGKSPLLYQLGICVASGEPFLGREVKRGRVLYLDYENGADAARGIVEKVTAHLGLEEPPSTFLYWTLDTATARWKPRSGPFKMIRDFRPVLVIVDPLSAFEPRMEDTNLNANLIVGKLREASRESGCAIVMTHHLAKPPRKGNRLEPLDTCNLTQWFSRTRGASALINSTDVRLGVEKPSRRLGSNVDGTQETALVLRGFARITGEIPLMRLARVFNERGEPVGYRELVGPRLLSNSIQQAAYEKLSRRFRFKDARMMYGKGDEATSTFLKKCISLKILRRTVDGYEKSDSAGISV
jgi:hypothetical protein